MSFLNSKITPSPTTMKETLYKNFDTNTKNQQKTKQTKENQTKIIGRGIENSFQKKGCPDT